MAKLMSIQEAMNKATPGPLISGVWEGDTTATITDNTLATLARVKDIPTAALLAHWYNHGPELLKALIQLEQALQHIENSAHQETPYDERALKVCFDDDRQKARFIIADASEVKL